MHKKTKYTFFLLYTAFSKGKNRGKRVKESILKRSYNGGWSVFLLNMLK